MHSRKPIQSTRMIVLSCAMVALLASASIAYAQDREERWEFALGIPYQLSSTVDFKGGSSVETQNDPGFSVAGGYHINNKFLVSFGADWASIDYDANAIREGGEEFRFSGSYDQWNTSGNMVYHFLERPLTPFVGAGIGYSWIDTNVPSGLPSTGCWFDPWWGWICVTEYPTKTMDSFFYQAMLGLRYEFKQKMFIRLSYTSFWADFENADGSPRFGVAGLEFGWMF